MKTSAIRILFILAAAALIGALAWAVPKQTANSRDEVQSILADTLEQLAKESPSVGSVGGEWRVLCLARSGYEVSSDKDFARYLSAAQAYIAENADEAGKLHPTRSTDNSRLILALSAIGQDATRVAGVDLVSPLQDLEWVAKQGINGVLFALIALDSKPYLPEDDALRTRYVQYILERQFADGGWAYSGTTADPDLTAIALQALRRYRGDAEVSQAAERAFSCLSALQCDDGGYLSQSGTASAESIAQVIVACAAWEIDPHTDSRFVKDSGSAIDALLRFYLPQQHGFARILADGDSEISALTTEQACYALVAYTRLLRGETALYDMSETGASL